MPDDEFASRLSLQSDERVLWSGRPDPKAPTLSPIDWIAVPFSLLWAGLTTSIFFFALRNHSPNLPPTVLAGIGVVVGTYLVAGRFLYKRWLRRRTRYFITTKRLITVRSVGGGMVEEAYIHDVGQIHRQERGVNIGTIVFGSAPFAERQYGETGMEPLGGVPRNAVPVFSDVRDPEKALRAFEAAKQAG